MREGSGPWPGGAPLFVFWRLASPGRPLRFLALFVCLVALYTVVRPVSTLMLARMVEGKSYQRIYAPLKTIAPAALAAVIASEDASFCDNDGVDWGALREVLSALATWSREALDYYYADREEPVFVAGPFRDSQRYRDWDGARVGRAWSKARTLEIYLNVAEWGEGLYGIEAAAQRYFHKSASQLNPREAALLATSLPNPIRRNPTRPSPMQRRLAASLEAKAREGSELLKCLPR